MSGRKGKSGRRRPCKEGQAEQGGTKRGGPRRFTEPEEIDRERSTSDNSSAEETSDSGDDAVPPARASPKQSAKAKKAAADSDSDDDHDIVNAVVGKVEGHKVIRNIGEVKVDPLYDDVEEESDDDGLLENPNKAANKVLKPSDLKSSNAASAAPQLSRREREAIEKERAKEHYMKLQMEGKTEQARNDLARLAIIRKQREDAARKKAGEVAEKSATSAKAASLNAGKAIITKTLGGSDSSSKKQ
ncbi:casein kinase substrate phosphoprotein PP28-domain-containing protein [Zopfochytrium polystomum]|nr:casein kinase substrate phosphoprotein PP28-domain-containing protein [Zopfochytrium polystomum]